MRKAIRKSLRRPQSDEEGAGMISLHLLVEGQSLGAIENSPLWPEEYYCHTCDRVWAVLEARDLPPTILNLTCQDHYDERSAYYPPGSIWESVEQQIDHLPEALLRREFWMHLQWIGALNELETNDETKARDHLDTRTPAGETPHCPNFLRRHE